MLGWAISILALNRVSIQLPPIRHTTRRARVTSQNRRFFFTSRRTPEEKRESLMMQPKAKWRKRQKNRRIWTWTRATLSSDGRPYQCATQPQTKFRNPETKFRNIDFSLYNFVTGREPSKWTFLSFPNHNGFAVRTLKSPTGLSDRTKTKLETSSFL